MKLRSRRPGIRSHWSDTAFNCAMMPSGTGVEIRGCECLRLRAAGPWSEARALICPGVRTRAGSKIASSPGAGWHRAVNSDPEMWEHHIEAEIESEGQLLETECEALVVARRGCRITNPIICELATASLKGIHAMRSRSTAKTDSC